MMNFPFSYRCRKLFFLIGFAGGLTLNLYWSCSTRQLWRTCWVDWWLVISTRVLFTYCFFLLWNFSFYPYCSYCFLSMAWVGGHTNMRACAHTAAISENLALKAEFLQEKFFLFYLLSRVKWYLALLAWCRQSQDGSVKKAGGWFSPIILLLCS